MFTQLIPPTNPTEVVTISLLNRGRNQRQDIRNLTKKVTELGREVRKKGAQAGDLE